MKIPFILIAYFFVTQGHALILRFANRERTNEGIQYTLNKARQINDKPDGKQEIEFDLSAFESAGKKCPAMSPEDFHKNISTTHAFFRYDGEKGVEPISDLRVWTQLVTTYKFKKTNQKTVILTVEDIPQMAFLTFGRPSRQAHCDQFPTKAKNITRTGSGQELTFEYQTANDSEPLNLKSYIFFLYIGNQKKIPLEPISDASVWVQVSLKEAPKEYRKNKLKIVTLVISAFPQTRFLRFASLTDDARKMAINYTTTALDTTEYASPNKTLAFNLKDWKNNYAGTDQELRNNFTSVMTDIQNKQSCLFVYNGSETKEKLMEDTNSEKWTQLIVEWDFKAKDSTIVWLNVLDITEVKFVKFWIQEEVPGSSGGGSLLTTETTVYYPVTAELLKPSKNGSIELNIDLNIDPKLLRLKSIAFKILGTQAHLLNSANTIMMALNILTSVTYLPPATNMPPPTKTTETINQQQKDAQSKARETISQQQKGVQSKARETISHQQKEVQPKNAQTNSQQQKDVQSKHVPSNSQLQKAEQSKTARTINQPQKTEHLPNRSFSPPINNVQDVGKPVSVSEQKTFRRAASYRDVAKTGLSLSVNLLTVATKIINFGTIITDTAPPIPRIEPPSTVKPYDFMLQNPSKSEIISKIKYWISVVYGTQTNEMSVVGSTQDFDFLIHTPTQEWGLEFTKQSKTTLQLGKVTLLKADIMFYNDQNELVLIKSVHTTGNVYRSKAPLDTSALSSTLREQAQAVKYLRKDNGNPCLSLEYAHLGSEELTKSNKESFETLPKVVVKFADIVKT